MISLIKLFTQAHCWSHHTHNLTPINGFFKLVKALLQIDWCFFSHSIKPRVLCFQQSLSPCITCQSCLWSTPTRDKRL